MATDYSKKTNADLVEILKSRSLPHTGKKAELVARLQEDDNKAAPAASGKADAAEDVIDWEDDDATTDAAAAKPSTEAGAETIAAGGKGPVANPVAVPNQKLDTDPAATEELKVESKPAEAGKEEEAQAATETEAPAEAKPAVDYTRGLPVTELEEELKKRKARAEKFGITEDSKAAIDSAEKKLERAKRFGTGPEAASEAPVGVQGLDEALPTEKARKRGRGDDQQGGRGGKRRDFGGRNKFRQRGNGKPQGQRGNRNNNTNSKPAQPALSEKDAAALEARKKRFATAA